MRHLKMLAALAVLGSATAVSVNAATINFTAESGSSWHDPANWDLLRVPEAGDDVRPSSKTIVVTSDAVFGEFDITNGAGTININSGGNLTGLEDYSLRYSTINVNDGGTFNGPLFGIRNTINVNAGGTMSGGIGLTVDNKTLTVAGTFSPRGTTLASGLSFTLGGSTTGVLDVKATGKVVLDLYGISSNEYFNVAGLTSGTKLKFAAGSAIELRPQDGYAPQMGDTFDLWQLADGSSADLTTLGNVANSITLVGSPYTLDTSEFVSTGVVTVVPEPASLGLLGLCGVLLLRARPRR